METTQQYVRRTLEKLNPPLTERELGIAEIAVTVALAHEETTARWRKLDVEMSR